ncbi:MAG: SRPBCC family protein [Sulfuritalea sp.]|nr:SRPBCC family protein [Sulfuritalea sp.]
MSQQPPARIGTDTAPEDRVRAETHVPISADALFEFVSDIGRLVRLNPHLFIETWQRLPDGMRLAAQNETTGRRIETAVRVETTRPLRTIVLSYADGLKQATTLSIEVGDGDGCRLIVTEHYPCIADAQDPRVADVDRSLIPWVTAIRSHLLGRQRWGWLPGWRWWHEHFMPGMPPRQRRIVRMIVWVGVLEFVVFLFVAAIFWAELQSG